MNVLQMIGGIVMNSEAIDFAEILEKRKKRIYGKIREYLPSKFPEEHYDMVKDYPYRKGKYLRPVLVMLANEMFDGRRNDSLLTAAAMQTSEDWILIHDDIEDDSETRRGKPCLHKIYGKERALNAGDALHIIMWKMLVDNYKLLGPERARKICDLMGDILLLTCEGQYLELTWILQKRFDVTETEYYRMIDAKAGAYSIYGPVQLGATVAHANDDQVNSAKKWGIPLGRAFMITDDILNLVGDQTKYGKEIGGDILEGKRTLLLIHLINSCSEEERQRIISIYSKRREEKTENDVNYVIDLMKKHGSIDYAKNRVAEFAEETVRQFVQSTLTLKDTFAKKAIRACIEFIVRREV
jgi:geranylgeranyl diphosphate synthase type II